MIANNTTVSKGRVTGCHDDIVQKEHGKTGRIDALRRKIREQTRHEVIEGGVIDYREILATTHKPRSAETG